MTKEEKAAQERGDELIDQMLADSGLGAGAVLGRSGLVARLTKRVVERALAGELTHHLGYAKGQEPPGENCRNGTSAKTLIGEDGPVEIAVPRDRAGTFEPLLIAKGQRRFEGFDEKIIALYARGLSVHLTRFSLAYCSWQDRKQAAGKLQEIYRSVTAAEGQMRLQEFEASGLGKKYQLIGPGWRRHWEEVIPFYDYAPEIRKMIYTTNAIESLHMQLRKVLKSRGHFPHDEAATKLMYLVLRNIARGWKVPAAHWHRATNQFAIRFGERFTAPGQTQAPTNKN